ncbi:hypothetical protein [Desulfonema magnum]|uniref:Uncharacterized protein n=1 Tax=Desulfonema magnum TaxID=45655 RepID=A0A975GP11_9BACT|nr:hypothetical protein [Desulfonema magnum]QTA88349.1 Uncharacterized protein dnm_043930 [Desulfonema magnum]
MNLRPKIFNCFIYLILIAISVLCFPLCPSDALGIETEKAVTPTDVYYLAKSIDNSLMAAHGLTRTLTKKRISDNLRPRNVYNKAVSVVEEFNFLHNNAIDPVRLSEARNLDVIRTRPENVYQVLSLISSHLIAENNFLQSMEQRITRTPNDVFQMLRQVSLHHHEIARKKNLTTDWATPERVYEAVVKHILPVAEGIAHEAGVKYKTFSFPKQPVSGVIPRYVYKLLYYVYMNISKFYMNKGGYEPILLVEVNDCDDISPADVFDLTQVIAAELKVRSGNSSLTQKHASRYASWKNTKEKIVSGDVFRLVQHNFILTKRTLEQN